MTIAIDYDGTITEDHEMFADIIRVMQRAGHNPIIVTMRYESEKDGFLKHIEENKNIKVSVYYTGRKAKIDYMAKLGIFPNIWIDDNPQWIFTDAR